MFGSKKYTLAVPIVLAVLQAGAAFAQDPEIPGGYLAQSLIDGNALSGAQGNIAINLVAGDSNAQLNATALATSFGQGIAAARVSGLQLTDAGKATSPDAAISMIGGQAFNNISGLVTINQASGQSNAQANGIAISMGYGEEIVAESSLGAIVSGLGTADPQAATGVRVTSVDATAFEGARGIVQINQLAGSGNATANNFALSISRGGNPE
jgi:hypothetical protein